MSSTLSSLSVLQAPTQSTHVMRKGDSVMVVTAPSDGSDFTMFPGNLAPAQGQFVALGADGAFWFFVGGWAAWKNTLGAELSGPSRYRYVAAAATAAPGDFILADTINGVWRLDLPENGLTQGDAIVVCDAQGKWPTNNLTINSGSKKIDGKWTAITCNQSQRLTFVWIGGSRQWSLFIDAPGADESIDGDTVALTAILPGSMVDATAREQIEALQAAMVEKADLVDGVVNQDQLVFDAVRIKEGFLEVKNPTTNKWNKEWAVGADGDATVEVASTGET